MHNHLPRVQQNPTKQTYNSDEFNQIPTGKIFVAEFQIELIKNKKNSINFNIAEVYKKPENGLLYKYKKHHIDEAIKNRYGKKNKKYKIHKIKLKFVLDEDPEKEKSSGVIEKQQIFLLE
jgi:hypothetical protein